MKIGRSIFAQKTEYDQQYHNATYIKLHVKRKHKDSQIIRYVYLISQKVLNSLKIVIFL